MNTTGFDCFGTDDVGFDYMSAIKGLAGGLAGVAGGGAAGGKDGGQAAIEKARLQDQASQAQRSASTMKMVLIGLGVLVGLGGIAAVISAGRK